MPRASKPTRLPGGGLSMATEPDFFVKQGDFQFFVRRVSFPFVAASLPMLYYREREKALADWERGWRDLFLETFPGSVAAIDSALGFTPPEEGAEVDDGDLPNADDGGGTAEPG
jgi:hypothetical protein